MTVFEGSASDFSGLFQNAKWKLCSWPSANKDFKDLKAGYLFQSWEGCMTSYQKKEEEKFGLFGHLRPSGVQI